MKIKKTLLFLLIFIAITGTCSPDTLFLKDGRIINSETVWEENGYYKYTKYGATVGLSKDRVERVEYSRKPKSSFQFDVWPFGITVKKAIAIAERNDIPLHRSGIISVNKRFHPNVRKYADAIHFYYNTNLLGHFAKVELLFTPKSKKLHTVKIQWSNQRTKDPKLTNEIMSMISGKYGNNKRQGKKLFYTGTEWNTKDRNKIEMRVHSTAIFLSYLHTEFRKLNHQEVESLKVQKIKAGSKQDKKKF